MLRIGIVGHRYLSAKEKEFVANTCFELLKKYKCEYQKVTALSALAEGADSIFAEYAIFLGIVLETVCPFKQYASDFTTYSSRLRYEELMSLAIKETKLNYFSRSDEAYMAAMDWIVENCHILIAAWDGSPAKGLGGTGDAVKKAISINREWYHLDTKEFSVTLYSSNAKI